MKKTIFLFSILLFFAEWEKDGLLSKAMEVLKGYCKGKLISQVDGKKKSLADALSARFSR